MPRRRAAAIEAKLPGRKYGQHITSRPSEYSAITGHYAALRVLTARLAHVIAEYVVPPPGDASRRHAISRRRIWLHYYRCETQQFIAVKASFRRYLIQTHESQHEMRHSSGNI